jgi:limonene-1,2-epoxide hydrolase
VVALVAGVSVLGLIGYMVISGLLGRGPAGAGSPEDAVKGFVTALQSKDAAAIAAALDPNEERQLVPLVEQVQKTAEAAGVTKKGQELAGIDVKIANVTYDSKNLSERLARVDITGGTIAVVTGDKSKLPLALQSLIVDPSLKCVDLGKLNWVQTNNRRDSRPFVMVVKEERGWFVSPLFTGAELLAQAQGVLGSYPDALPTATTEKTAADAVKQFLKAVASKNPDAVLARLVPQEQSVLRTYDRLWRPYLNEAMSTEAWNATNLQVSVNKMTDTDLGDGSTGVAIESADVAVASISGSGNYSLEKDCVQGAGNGAQCLKSWNSYNSGLSESAQQGGTSARVSLVAVKTGDAFAVSLLGTAAATSRSALAALDAKEIFRGFDMKFLLPTGGSLGVGQQLTIDAASKDNVTLRVDKEANIVLKVDSSGNDLSLDLWSASGSRRYGEYPSDGSAGSLYTLPVGQYRITWPSNMPSNSKITISATTR